MQRRQIEKVSAKIQTLPWPLVTKLGEWAKANNLNNRKVETILNEVSQGPLGNIPELMLRAKEKMKLHV